MEQYIKKSALLEHLATLLDKKKYSDEYEVAFRDGNNSAIYAISHFLNTLEVKEVDLEKEVESLIKSFIWRFADKEDFLHIAKHFFELGLSVSNSTKVTAPDIDDVLKENGVNPYSKEARVFKESYYMALEKLKA